MSVELISKIIATPNANTINGTFAQRKLAEAILKNMYQGLVEKGGRGINDNWVSEEDAQSKSQVMVNRILPVKMQPRAHGTNKNGGSFSENQHYTQTETVAIDLLTWMDDPIIIPRARQDMIPTDLTAEHIDNWSNRLATVVNGATTASHLIEVYLAGIAGKATNHVEISSSDVTNKLVLQRFIEANTLLDEGDEEHDIDLFPNDNRVAIFKVAYRPTLKGAGVLVLGGANDAYEILRKGGIDKDGEVRKSEDGYIGEIDGVPCHIISNESLGHAADFLGLPTKEFRASGSPFIGYLTSGYANARGVSSAERVKVVDSVAGQGVVLQPYVKMGAKTFYQKGVVTLGTAEFNPLKDLATIFTSGVTWQAKASGSRLYGTGATWTGPSASAFTVSNLKCLDDSNTDHLVGAKYVITSSKIDTVAGFIAAYNAASAVKGSVTIGTEVGSLTIADGSWVNVLAVADDGTVTIVSKQYNA